MRKLSLHLGAYLEVLVRLSADKKGLLPIKDGQR
jgi:hypothetical protein